MNLTKAALACGMSWRSAAFLLAVASMMSVSAFSRAATGLTAVSAVGASKQCEDRFGGRHPLSGNGTRTTWVRKCYALVDPENAGKGLPQPSKIMISDLNLKAILGTSTDFNLYQGGFSSADPGKRYAIDPATYGGNVSQASISDDGHWLTYVAELKKIDASGERLVPTVMLAHLRATADLASLPLSAADSIVPIAEQGQRPYVNGDGSYVTFIIGGDVYWYDRVGGRIDRIRPVGATEWDGLSFDPTISDDGKLIAFSSTAALTDQDKNPGIDVYLFDRRLGTIKLLSTRSATAAPDLIAPSYDPTITADGQRVFYTSSANILAESPRDFNSVIYMYDIASGQHFPISGHDTSTCGDRNVWKIPDGASATGRWMGCRSGLSWESAAGSGALAARPSRDGRYVAFLSGNLYPVPLEYLSEIVRIPESDRLENESSWRVIVADLATGEHYIRSNYYDRSRERWVHLERGFGPMGGSLGISADGQTTAIGMRADQVAGRDYFRDDVPLSRGNFHSLYLGNGLGVRRPFAPAP